MNKETLAVAETRERLLLTYSTCLTSAYEIAEMMQNVIDRLAEVDAELVACLDDAIK